MTLTYLDDLGRVRIELSGVLDGFALIERSTNQIYWETVRGGAALPVVGGAATLYDYEFAANTENFYRVSITSDASAYELVGVGSAATSASTTGPLLVPMPGGVQAGDLVFIYASAEIGTVNQPAGYSTVVDTGHSKVFLLGASGQPPAPQLTVTGGASNGSFIAQAAVWRGPFPSFEGIDTRTASDASRILTPGLEISTPRCLVLLGGWRNGTWSGSPTLPPGSTLLGNAPGSQSGQVWSWLEQEAASNIGASQFGGLNPMIGAATEAFVVAIAPAGSTSDTQSITPALGGCEIWLKSVRFPSLNQAVTIADYSPLSQPGRVGVFNVEGRSFPVGVTDVAGAYSAEITLVADTAEQARKLSLSLAVGDLFYLQVSPDGNPQLPPRSMYVVVSDTNIARLGVEEKRHITVSVQEVAQPAPQLAGATLTWGTVLDRYGRWPQLMNAEPSWTDLLAVVGSPEDLVVI